MRKLNITRQLQKNVDLKLTQRDAQIVVSVSLETKMTTM